MAQAKFGDHKDNIEPIISNVPNALLAPSFCNNCSAPSRTYSKSHHKKNNANNLYPSLLGKVVFSLLLFLF